MLKPRWSKVLADFWENKARTSLVIASISVGVFAVGMIGVGYSILPKGLKETYAASVPANIVIRTEPFQHDLIEMVREIEGVQAAEGRRTVSVRARALGSQAGWDNLMLTAVEDYGEAQIKLLSPVSGDAVPPDRSVLLLEQALPLMEVAPEETLEIQLWDDSLRQLPISGVTNDFSAGIELSFNARVGFITFETLEFLHAGTFFDTLILTVKGDPNDWENIEGVAKRVIQTLEDLGRQTYGSDLSRSGDHPYTNYLNALIAILSLLGLLVLILGSFLIVNTMNALMAQQLRQIGVMKLIGARRWQIVMMYLVLVLLFGVLGLLAAIPSSAAAAYPISDTVAGMLNGRLTTDTSVPFLPWVIAVQAVLALAVPLAAAAAPIARGAGVTVRRALSGTLIRQTGRERPLDRWLRHVRWARGILLLSIRNTFRRLDRLALTLFTLSLGGAIFIAVFNVQTSLERQIERIVNYGRADVYLQLGRSYPIDEVRAELGVIPGITFVEAWQAVYAQLETGQQVEDVTLQGPPDDTRIVKRVTRSGRWVLPEDQQALVVNEAFLNSIPDLEPGSSLRLKVNGEDVDWTVVGMFHYSGLDHKLAYTNFATLSRLLHTTTHSASFRIVTERHTLAYQQAMADVLQEHLRERGFDVASATPLQERVEEASSKLDMIIFVLLVQASLTGLVGSIGLSGTMSLNVLERTAEIGVLRAVGAHDRVVTRLVMSEGMFIGLASYLIGAVIALPITRLLSNLVNIAVFGSPAVFSVTSQGYLIWFGVILLLTTIASLGPARSATRLTIREVLAYE